MTLFKPFMSLFYTLNYNCCTRFWLMTVGRGFWMSSFYSFSVTTQSRYEGGDRKFDCIWKCIEHWLIWGHDKVINLYFDNLRTFDGLNYSWEGCIVIGASPLRKKNCINQNENWKCNRIVGKNACYLIAEYKKLSHILTSLWPVYCQLTNIDGSRK